MTSKIVVNNIESDSGISSVTFTSDIELGTKNLKGHNLESTGIVTAVSFTGSGANLTNLPAGNLSGTLPALDGSALTGVGVGTADSINTSGIITATAFVPTTGQLSHRNLVINGAMMISQRGTSASTTNGYGSVDRVRLSYNSSGLDEVPSQIQSNVSTPSSPYHLPTSGDHPYKEGFRKCFNITNGNQTSGAGANDFIKFQYRIEAQDIANSGWNYTDPNSFITLSFWIKSSVAQNFYGYLETFDTSGYLYPFETGSLSAFTWTKVTKKIPGNSNLTVDNDNGSGLQIEIQAFMGTDSTSSGVALNTWAAYAAGTRTPDQTSTWFTTNDASLEITGLQLEVGSVATPFEHRSYGEELIRCKRYFNMVADGAEARSGSSRSEGTIGNGFFWQSTRMMVPVKFQVAMRTPNWTLYKKNGEYRYYANGQSNQTCTQNDIGLNGQDGLNSAHLNITNISSSSAAGMFFVHDVNAALGFDAEL